VIPTIGLFALTSLSPPEVAGTALVTYIAAGVLGTAAYTRSGQLREPDTRRTALILAGTALLGTPVGVLVNTAFSRRTFGVLLGIMVALAAMLVWYANTADRPRPQRNHRRR
jgi:uncharacterized membrane protein YfcA